MDLKLHMFKRNSNGVNLRGWLQEGEAQAAKPFQTATIQSCGKHR
jgi:hypothetical protein